MNTTIVKDRCRVSCKDVKQLRVISFDEFHGSGCDLIVVVEDKGVIYIVECKESLRNIDTAKKIIEQINKCYDFIEKNMQRYRSVRKIYIKERRGRVYSPLIDPLKREGIELYSDVLEIHN